MKQSGSELLREVGGKGVELPALATSVTRIMQGLNDENSNRHEIAELMSGDVAIASRVLALSNSPLYNPIGTPFASVEEAISRIGFVEVRNLVVASSVIDKFAPADCPFDYTEFWKHSLTAAIAADALSERSTGVVSYGRRGDNPYFVAGLLHDIGVFLLAQCQSEAYGAVIANAAEIQRPLAAVEQECFGYTHGEVGAALIREWGLPEGVATAAEFHHDPNAAPSADRTWAEVIHLADWIADHEGVGLAVDRYSGGFEQGTWLNLGIGIEEIPDVILDFSRAAERSEMMLALLKE